MLLIKDEGQLRSRSREKARVDTFFVNSFLESVNSFVPFSITKYERVDNFWPPSADFETEVLEVLEGPNSQGRPMRPCELIILCC